MATAPPPPPCSHCRLWGQEVKKTEGIDGQLKIKDDMSHKEHFIQHSLQHGLVAGMGIGYEY